MSTRSQIAFYSDRAKDLRQFDALIYRHSDGYPEGVLPDLLPVLEDFHRNRGLGDTEYAAAWLVAAAWKSDYLNIGISHSFHGDIEHLYAVYPDGVVDVYAVDYDGDFDAEDRQDFRFIKRETLSREPVTA